MSDISLESLDRLLFWKRNKREPPKIYTEGGLLVSECARRQAALNMRSDPEVKARVEQALVLRMGSLEKGRAEARRRYPEAWA